MIGRKAVALLGIALLPACVSGASVNAQDTGANGDGASTGKLGPAQTFCVGDPDTGGGCSTFWTCQNVPIAYGHKTHCEGKHPAGMTPSGSPRTGSFDCPAGVAGGDACPPSKGGSASHCTAAPDKITCDTGQVCDAGGYASGTSCTQCTSQNCAMEVCTNAIICGGDGMPSHRCAAGQFWLDGRCVDCTSTTCNQAQCATAQICQPCPTGEFNDGTGCRPCVGGSDCYHPACAALPACTNYGQPGGGGSPGGIYPGAGPNVECHCVEGAIRYCDGPNMCNFGIRTCRSDGTWGRCDEEMRVAPQGCKPGDYNPNCCVRSGACCEDWSGLPIGNCAATCSPQ